jgi:hypothetical protein
MTIIDAMTNRSDFGDVRVVCGTRWLNTKDEDGATVYSVRDQQYRQKHSRCLVETENEDEAVRYLVGLKD